MQSDALPSNPRMGVRVTEGPKITAVETSTMTVPQCHTGHVFWSDAGGNRFYAAVDSNPRSRPSEPRPLKLPAASPLKERAGTTTGMSPGSMTPSADRSRSAVKGPASPAPRLVIAYRLWPLFLRSARLKL